MNDDVTIAGFTGHVKLAPQSSTIMRLFRYSFALVTIPAMVLFPVMAAIYPNSDLFVMTLLALLVGYMALFMRIATYYLFSTKTYYLLIKPYLYINAWRGLIKEDTKYWWYFLDSFFALLPVVLVVMSFVFRPLLAILAYYT